MPASASASLQAFETTAPIAGVTDELWPWGFGLVTSQNGAVWGDDAGDTFATLTRVTSYISVEATAGGPQSFIAFNDRNPLYHRPYIKLKKNGVCVDGLDTHMATPARSPATPYINYISENGTIFWGVQRSWYIPIYAVTLEPGCAYEFSFLRGLTANSGVTGVIYTDPLGNNLGYIVRDGIPVFPDEDSQYAEKQWDTYRFRNPFDNQFEDFLFRFQTYADTTAFETALASAQSALTTATANMGTGPGQVDPERVAVLSSAVTSAAAVPLSTVRERLQPEVDAAVTELGAAVAQAQVLNPPPESAPVTTVLGIPSGWATTAVTFSLEATGDFRPFTSSYALGGGLLQIYSTPVTVSSEGVTALSYRSVDSSGQIEATQSASIRIDTTAPSTTFSRMPASEPSSGSVIFTLAAADPVSGVGSVRYVLDGAGPGSTYHAPVAVFGVGAHGVSYWAIDVAGNVEDAHTATFTIAAAPPVTNKTGLPVSWSSTPVTFTLSVSGDAPPFSTYYHLDGGLAVLYSGPVSISAEGTTTVQYYSVDSLGQTETVRTALARIDTIAPASAISGVADGGLYPAGLLSFTLSATDAGSGISSIMYSLDGAGSITYSSPVSVTGAGSHTLSWHAVDVAGNAETAHTVTFRVSAGAPVTTASGIPSTWTASPVTFSLEATGDAPPIGTHYALGSGAVTAYSAPVTVSNQGVTTLSYYSSDSLGQIEATKTAEIRVDSLPPTSTISGLPAGGVALGSVTFSLAATDGGSGVKKISYVLDSSPTTSTYTAPVAVSAPGAHTLVWWGLDNAGNKEAAQSASFRVTAGAPVTTVSGIPGSWSTSPVTFSLLATGDAPPISTYYSLGGLPPVLYGAPVTVTSQGVTSLAYYSGDVLGQNEIARNAEIRIDSLAPVTTLAGVADGGVYLPGSATFTLSAADSASGVSATVYSLDGGAASSYSSPVSVPGSGSHTLSWYSTDVAGNVETAHSATFHVSAGPPATSVSGIPAGWSTSPVTFTLLPSGDAPPYTSYYTLGGGSSTLYAAPVTVSAEGTTDVSYHSADVLGQSETAKTATIRIDATPPTTSSDATASYVASATVRLSAVDAVSGVAHTYYRLDGGRADRGQRRRHVRCRRSHSAVLVDRRGRQRRDGAHGLLHGRQAGHFPHHQNEPHAGLCRPDLHPLRPGEADTGPGGRQHARGRQEAGQAVLVLLVEPHDLCRAIRHRRVVVPLLPRSSQGAQWAGAPRHLPVQGGRRRRRAASAVAVADREGAREVRDYDDRGT